MHHFWRARSFSALFFAATILAAVFLTAACDTSTPYASARQVTSRDELVKGKRALGDLGDFVLSNGRIRAVIQGNTPSRGMSTFGGALIDLDLERPDDVAAGDEVNLSGDDGVADIFPAFLLRGLKPDDVFIKADGSDGGPAIVTVRGRGDEFMTMVKAVNDLLLSDDLYFEVDYILDPVLPDAPAHEGRSLRLRVTARNASETNTVKLATESMPVGFGLVVLMGAGQPLFLPGKAGFDLRYALIDAYADPPTLPAIAGVVTRAIVTSGERVSYAMAPEPSRNNFVWHKRDRYEDATDDSLIIPFVADSFTGAFFHTPPSTLAPGESTSFDVRVFVGSGDVASAMDLLWKHRGEAVGTFSAQVLEEVSQTPVRGATVTLTEIDSDKVLASCRTEDTGRCTALVQPGRYRASVAMRHRPTRHSEVFEIAVDGTHHETLSIGRTARLTATVIDADSGRPLPAKLSIIGRYGEEHVGKSTEEFLFDPRLGEPFRYTDMVADDAADPSTREYLEHTFYTGARGVGATEVLPGTYRVVASRGIAYDLAETEVTVEPGGKADVDFALRHVAKSPGYVHSDLHLHSVKSIDSDLSLEDRAITCAAEGLEVATMSDHNFITDLEPAAVATSLRDWLLPMVGLEMTTLELGHFNGFPLVYDPGAITHGSFDWYLTPAQQIFDGMRALSACGSDETVIQVNHPRDGNMGYFNAFALDEDASPRLPTAMMSPSGPEFALEHWSEDFDALEILNGKHTEYIHSLRVPLDYAPPADKPHIVPGEIYRDETGSVVNPGGFDDWMALLRKGRTYVGMANSDSHDFLTSEAGYGRSLVRVGRNPESMRALDQCELTRAIRQGAVMMTNGPMVDLTVNGAPTGTLATTENGKVTLRIDVWAAPWIDVSRVYLYDSSGNRELVPLDATPDPDGVRRLSTRLEKTLNADDFFLVEVEGERSLWPVVPGLEQPPLMIADAVGSLLDAFGMAEESDPALALTTVHPIQPWAMTNPVWVDADGDGMSFGKRR
ncbi:MAG: CehA/McbA family metallohydrolase [Myxococcaceae bacterium]|nr:CehA/McbA family metallohydrolase [Myxococcaceae bacterium]